MKNLKINSLLLWINLIFVFGFFVLYAQPPSTPCVPMATTDAPVHCAVKSGDTLFIGGSFMMLRNPDNSIALRNRIAAIDLNTGFALPWNPNSDGPVLTMAISGNLLYVGGGFSNIGGQLRNNIAALKTDTDYFIANTWNPDANSLVSKIILSGTNVYCAGGFSLIGNASRNGLACVTTMMDEDNATSWNPIPNGSVLDIVLVGNTMYVAGSFISIGGLSRSNIAALNTTNNNATSWNPLANNTVMAISCLGNTLYAAGSFTSIGGQARTRIAALDMLVNSNNATSWNPDVNGTINTLKAFNGRIYIGGTFSLVNNISRNFLASLDASLNSNNTTSWNPVLDSYVEKIIIQDSIVIIGGNFAKVNNNDRAHFAMFRPVLPTLTTNNITNITVNSAVSGGNITADGGPSVIRRGVCWSINPNPTIADDTTINGTGIGSFASTMTGLSIYTNYKVRAYATSAIGTSYGNEISFYTLPAIYTGTISGNQFCVGDTIVIPYDATPGFEDANYFIAQLSDYLGSFANPIVLDSIHSKESGEIKTRIPLNSDYGVNYRFRVVASQISSSIRDNGMDIQINKLPNVYLNPLPDVCISQPAMDLTSGTPVGGNYSGPGVVNNQFDAAVAGVGSHTITYSYSDGFGCFNYAKTEIKVNPLPVVNFQIQPDICIDAPPLNLASGSPEGGTYSGNGINGSTFDPKTAGVGKHTITYSYSDQNGCSNSVSSDINVNPLPIVTISSMNDVCLNSESFRLTAGSPSGGNYTGTGVADNSFNPSDAGVGIHTIQYTYTDNKGCTDSATSTIKVKPIPPKPVITQTDYRTLSSSADFGNQWFINGVIMNGDTNKILHPTASAKYTVLVSGDNGCQSDLSDEYVFHNLGVNDNNLSSFISVFPVPADNELIIKINSVLTARLKISICNILGEKIISKEISGFDVQNSFRINTVSLTEGIYILNISSGKETINSKIIIQR
ncbi:MAG: T9SS type A sorting domain-containing protein [Bacteroidetes bacterium]|nr:MAG: T9SS type A sorting domain-containing protein [Bacteroidota bacterium]